MNLKKKVLLKDKVSTMAKVVSKTKRPLNAELISLLVRLQDLMIMKGEMFRARAYQKAAETVMLYQEDITDISQLKGRPNIGATIMKKFAEYMETGKLKVLEKAKNNPVYEFTKIYGIGPKKAKELVEKDKVTTIAQLRERKDELLNNVQKKGIKYYEDILKRIPRDEINEYKKELDKVFKKLKNASGSTFEIVGSYRRGASNSGDIDIIITNKENII